ncbi:hypothetical protein IMZ48_37645 [Candidatus Bathyarchaeota archaeon]|nr:hypothetical protein [Candidatus Bathyarchaeota archaeon]
MEECVAQCAEDDECAACGWGRGIEEKGKERCWLKGPVGGEHEVKEDWTFAILEK